MEWHIFFMCVTGNFQLCFVRPRQSLLSHLNFKEMIQLYISSVKIGKIITIVTFSQHSLFSVKTTSTSQNKNQFCGSNRT